MRPNLFLEVQSGGVRWLLGEYLAEYLTCFRKPCGFDEAARERDPQVVGVRRGYAFAKEFDRGVGIAELARRFGRDGVVAGNRPSLLIVEPDGVLRLGDIDVEVVDAEFVEVAEDDVSRPTRGFSWPHRVLQLSPS